MVRFGLPSSAALLAHLALGTLFLRSPHQLGVDPHPDPPQSHLDSSLPRCQGCNGTSCGRSKRSQVLHLVGIRVRVHIKVRVRLHLLSLAVWCYKHHNALCLLLAEQ